MRKSTTNPNLASNKILILSLCVAAFTITGCAKNSQPSIDVDYEKRLIEYEFCLNSKKEYWDNLLGKGKSDIPYQQALKECEGLRP